MLSEKRLPALDWTAIPYISNNLPWKKGGDAFTLVLARSGREFVVPEDMTILQVIENNKAARVECLCREGVCGTCETTILEGEADHRDQYFSDDEKASQQSMLICCSRAKGKRLVLDL